MMTIEEFIEELIDILELDEKNITLHSQISLDSLQAMSIIAFLDNAFSKKTNADALNQVTCIHDILILAGEENIQ